MDRDTILSIGKGNKSPPTYLRLFFFRLVDGEEKKSFLTITICYSSFYLHDSPIKPLSIASCISFSSNIKLPLSSKKSRSTPVSGSH